MESHEKEADDHNEERESTTALAQHQMAETGDEPSRSGNRYRCQPVSRSGDFSSIHVSWILAELSAVEAIAKISQTGQDEFLIVQPSIDGGGVDGHIGTVPGEKVDPFGSGDDREQSNVFGTVLVEKADRRPRRSPGSEHGVENQDDSFLKGRKLAVVLPGDCSLFVALEAHVTDRSVRQQLKHDVQHSQSGSKDGHENDVCRQATHLGFLERCSDPLAANGQVSRSLDGDEHRDLLRQETKAGRRRRLVTQRRENVVHQWVFYDVDGHQQPLSCYHHNPFTMRVVDILRRKRDGSELEPEEIDFFVQGSASGAVPDYQIAAFLMAVYLKGMSDEETFRLTRSMLLSGAVMDFGDIPGVKIDKHSTGGVGDKVSLIVAPIAASAGVVVPMLSGRGLGHTGGTLDKLESIPGFDVRLDRERFGSVVRRVGAAMAGPTQDIAPADRKLYELRDATSTVESLPLITGSILSKKLAEGIDGLVLDVKTGSGAFMKTDERAKLLARMLLDTTRKMGKKAVALLTDMSQPLGDNVGNALEVEEALSVLEGGGPADLVTLSLRLAAEMLVLGGVASSRAEAEKKVAEERSSGRGREKFLQIVEAQGGDPGFADRRPFDRASASVEVRARRDGFVTAMDAELVGTASMLLGAGRERREDPIDRQAGLVVHAKIGAELRNGERLVTLHFNDRSRVERAVECIQSAFEIRAEPPRETPRLVREVLAQETSA